MSLFAANIIAYVKKPQRITELIRESSKCAKYRNWEKIFVTYITEKKYENPDLNLKIKKGQTRMKMSKRH